VSLQRFTSCDFYPNVATLRSGICYRKSVCRLSSVVCPSSATFLRPTQGIETFAIIPSPLKFYDRPRGTPPSGALNTTGVAK